MTTETKEQVARVSRLIEDVGFAVGLSLLALFGLAELAVYVAVSFSVVPRVDAPTPWIVILFALLAVLPKYMGRATAGQVWIILAKAVADFIARRKNGRATTSVPAVEVEMECGTCKNKMSMCVCPEPAPTG